MTPSDELLAIAGRLEGSAASPDFLVAEGFLSRLDTVAAEAGRAFSGSWLGYHANVYYENLTPPPSGAHFSQEWGLQDLSYTSLGSKGEWLEFDPVALRKQLMTIAGNPDLTAVQAAAIVADEAFNAAKAEIRSIILTENSSGQDAFLAELLADLDKLGSLTAGQIAAHWSPKGYAMTRDTLALNQSNRIPPHVALKAEVASIRNAFSICRLAGQLSRRAASHISRQAKRNATSTSLGTKVFIGHGRSAAWRELKDFVHDRLRLPWDEFNRVPVAGVANQVRLSDMLREAIIALIVMTAEDETAEGRMQARMNVIHEVGLFQGRLGFTRAIVLLEEGCKEFSNIQGLGQIRFPVGRISSCFEEVRRVLEREQIV
jgi:hypothetical protein